MKKIPLQCQHTPCQIMYAVLAEISDKLEHGETVEDMKATIDHAMDVFENHDTRKRHTC